MLTPRAHEAGVTLELDACDATVPVDGQRLTQLIGNLVSNAIAVTPRDGVVTVTLERSADGSSLRGSVIDGGPGISPEIMPHLFTAFWRGERRDRDGVGLGLWIARAIAEAHGGDLTAVSRPDGGAVFSFVLPFVNRERRRED
jgi:two-component system sensor histidine kinase BaeS